MAACRVEKISTVHAVFIFQVIFQYKWKDKHTVRRGLHRKKHKRQKVIEIAHIEKALLFMIVLRLIGGSIEVSAALLMLKFNDLEKAFYINTLLALVGPTILIVTTGIGLVGLADKIPLTKMICLFSGIVLILFSLKSN